MNKHFLINYLLFPAVLFLFTTCYDPVFFTISQEVEPVEPLIKGSPTNFAPFNNRVYVASGSALWRYTGNSRPKWNKVSKPSGLILQIASTPKFLYILCYNDNALSGKTLLRMDVSGKWTDAYPPNTGNNNNFQNIYSAGDTLFLSVMSGSSYSVFYIGDLGGRGGPVNGEMSGAAFDGTDYYICTKESGIYKLDSAMTPEKISNENVVFMGIINLEDSGNTVAAITREGEIYLVDKANNTVSKKSGISFGGWSTGALAIWRDNDDQWLLLAGRQGQLEYTTASGYTYGYMELKINKTTGISGTFNEPGLISLTTDANNEQFKSTIGKYSVSYIFQTPKAIDPEMRLFASTQKNGVWSYKVRNRKPQWNAEADDDP